MNPDKEVQVIDIFNTSRGLVFAVRANDYYHVGQTIMTDGISYIITDTGINSSCPNMDIAVLRVEKVTKPAV